MSAYFAKVSIPLPEVMAPFIGGLELASRIASAGRTETNCKGSSRRSLLQPSASRAGGPSQPSAGHQGAGSGAGCRGLFFLRRPTAPGVELPRCYCLWIVMFPPTTGPMAM